MQIIMVASGFFGGKIMVSQQLLEELKLIIKEEYKVDLDSESLSEVGNGLTSFFDLLAKIDHRSTKDVKN